MAGGVAPCVLCGSTGLQHWSDATDAEYFSTPEPFSFYECAACRLLQIHPVPADRLPTIYPANYYSFSGGSRGVVERIKDVLDRRLFRRLLAGLRGDRLRVLDVGGGSGWMLDTLRSVSSRVAVTQVVDIDRGAERAARAKGHQFFCGPIEAFRPREKFDFVLLLNLIEHVADPLQVMRQVNSLLTDQGVVLVKTPNYDALDARLFRHGNWGGYHCPRHWVLFTQESFGRLAQASGLQVQSLSFTQGAPFWAASVLGWLHARGLVQVSGRRPVCGHPLFSPLLALFAAFDLLRLPFARTSQMFIILKKAPAAAPPGAASGSGVAGTPDGIQAARG